MALLCGVTLSAANFVKLMLFDRVAVQVAFVICITLVVTVFVAKIVGCSFLCWLRKSASTRRLWRVLL